MTIGPVSVDPISVSQRVTATYMQHLNSRNEFLERKSQLAAVRKKYFLDVILEYNSLAELLLFPLAS
jgi:hypothetical protein